MEKIFVLNPALNLFDIKNAIDERITKIQSIVVLLMSACEKNGFSVNEHIVNTVLWTIEGYLNEMECLHDRLDDLIHTYLIH